MLWSSVIRGVRDVGNGTADVDVEIMQDGKLVRAKTYNFHAGQVTKESIVEEIQREMKALSDFTTVAVEIATVVGVEITPEDKPGDVFAKV